MTAPSGQTVTINFDDFETQYSSSCSFDFLVLYDGDSTSESEIGTYCGTNSPGCISSSAENLLLYLESNSGSNERGFSATFNFRGKY